jgi:sigma-B regulation protein RsbU (phosphoserine phosphatase)
MDNGFSDEGYLLQNLMDTMTDNIYFKDLQSRFIMVNKAAAKWQGFNLPEDAVGTSDFDKYTEEDARRMFEDEQRIIATGEPLMGIEEQETSKDGRVAWVSTTKMPLRNEAGEIIGTFGISRDITEHKAAELRAQRYAAEINAIKEEMEDDLRMAGELQKTFFPGSYPVFPEGATPEDACIEFLHRSTSCSNVSGDYCSIMRLAATEAGIFLCDVRGLGVRAALGTALIRGLVQEIVPQGLEPGAYLSRMNELLIPLVRHEEVLLDITACYLVLDAATGKIRLASAGHPAPIHFRQGRDVKWLFENLSLRGPTLATQSSTTYPTIECQAEPGDAIVLFTDGLYTVENASGKAYGEKRLLDSARNLAGKSLADIFQGLEGEARAFAFDGPFSDDVCITGVRLRNLLR